MRVQSLLAFLVVSILAGCASPGPEETPTNEGPSVVTDPKDLLNGTAPGSHIHDYWGGRSAVPILDEWWDGPIWFCGACSENPMMFAEVRPGEGMIVPQGTRWVNGTFTITPGPDDNYDRLELWVKTANDTELKRWGDLKSGQAFSIETSKEMNDPPHYVLSLWKFAVAAYGSGEVRASGTMAWNAEAVRGLPLVPYPPHPDRWNATTSLTLLQEQGGSPLTYRLDIPGYMYQTQCFGGCPATHVPMNGAVVPHDATTVKVHLKIEMGMPIGLGLYYHGADTWTFQKPTGELLGPGEYEFTIPVEATGDSPYAPQSLWEFLVWMDQPQPLLQPWSGVYSISATVHR